jgi:plasmid stability protein
MVLHIRDFPEELHKWLKVEAVQMDISLYQHIINILTEHKENKEREGK